MYGRLEEVGLAFLMLMFRSRASGRDWRNTARLPIPYCASGLVVSIHRALSELVHVPRNAVAANPRKST